MITNKDLDFIEYKQGVYIGTQKLLNTHIVRYTTLENLHLLLSGMLHSTPRYKFDDLREQGRVKDMKNAFRLQFADGSDRKHWQQIDEKIEYSRNLLTSCWSSNTHEDVLMWKAYNASVRIKTSVEKVLNSMYDTNVDMIICDEVKYILEKPHYTLVDAMFCKDKSYYNEHEVRFYFDKVDKETCKGRINIKTEGLIEEVIISPFINREAKVLLSYIQNDYPNIFIKDSAILEQYEYYRR